MFLDLLISFLTGVLITIIATLIYNHIQFIKEVE